MAQNTGHERKRETNQRQHRANKEKEKRKDGCNMETDVRWRDGNWMEGCSLELKRKWLEMKLRRSVSGSWCGEAGEWLGNLTRDGRKSWCRENLGRGRRRWD